MNNYLHRCLISSLILICSGNVFNSLIAQIASADFYKKTILNDKTAVVPGIGSDGVVLGEDIDQVLQRYGNKKFRISKPNRGNELFKNVFKVECAAKLYFDAIYYNDSDKFAVCVFQNIVIGVIGFDVNRVTIDRVNLQGGINNFIFNYGNKGLSVIRGGNNALYIYRGLGIIAVDDGTNDTIDMYIVFVPQGVR